MERRLEQDIYLNAKGEMTYDEKEGVELHLAAGSYLRYPKDIAFVDGQSKSKAKKAEEAKAADEAAAAAKKAEEEAEAKKKAEEEAEADKKAEEAKTKK